MRFIREHNEYNFTWSSRKKIALLAFVVPTHAPLSVTFPLEKW